MILINGQGVKFFMIQKFFLLANFFISSAICSCSSNKRIISFERVNLASSSNFSKKFKKEKEETPVSRLELAIESNNEKSFTSILKTVGCEVMEPEQNDLLKNLVSSKNENFLFYLFSKACPRSYDLFVKAIDLAYATNDKMTIKVLLLSIYGPFVNLSDSLVDIFLKKNDYDAIHMILDIGYSLDHYIGKYNKNIVHIAAENGRLDIIKKLSNRSLFLKKDFYGKSPIFYAQDVKMIKEIRRKCPLARDQVNAKNLTTWQESLLSKDFTRLNALISLKRRIKKLKRTFINFHDIGWRSTASILKINRENILSESYKEVKKISNKWYKPRNEFFIKYIGEIGMDNGGLKVDWVNNLFKNFFSDDLNTAIFVKIDDETGCYAPNVNYNPKMFKFAGSVVALSIGLGVPMKVKLIPAIYRCIFKEPLDFDRDLLEQSPSVYNNLRKLQDPSIKLSDLDLTFPNNPSKKVIKRNLTSYIKEYSFHSIYGAYKAQIEAFVEGFNSVMSDQIRKLITLEELVQVLIGNSSYTAEDFFDHCTCSSLEVKIDLYEIITEFTSKQKSLLLKFITGSETLPFEGFQGLKTGKIEVCVLDELFEKFPTSSTCSNLLKLPPYFSVEELKTKLVAAIEMTETIDFEPGLTEQDEIVLGFDDDRVIVANRADSESEVSTDEAEVIEENTVTPQQPTRRFRTII